MFTGIILGVGAAISQSLSYVVSRRFVSKFHRSTLSLLVMSHVIMAGLAAAMVPFMWPDEMPALRVYAPALAYSTVFYLVAQAALFMALRQADASRVSPLLGVKILILTLIGVCFRGQHFSLPQYGAVALGVVATVLLSWSGGRVSARALGWIGVACLGYCLSDINIRILVGHFNYLGLAHSAALSTCLSYLASGVLAVVALSVVRERNAQVWLHAAPFAIAWFAAMLCLFACFGSIGVVFGNLIQSTRGIISVILGAALAAAGFEHLETRVTRKVLLRRICAAMLMTGAIALFYSGS